MPWLGGRQPQDLSDAELNAAIDELDKVQIEQSEAIADRVLTDEELDDVTAVELEYARLHGVLWQRRH